MLGFLVTSAIAQEVGTAVAKQPSVYASIAPLLLVMVVFYFLIIRPQSKRTKMHQEMLKKLEKGDQVVTAGGIFGEVAKVDNDKGMIWVQIAENVKVRLKQDSVVEIIQAQSATNNAT